MGNRYFGHSGQRQWYRKLHCSREYGVAPAHRYRYGRRPKPVSNTHDHANRHQLLHQVPNIGGVAVHVDPLGEEGESHHRIAEHEHDGLPMHSH